MRRLRGRPEEIYSAANFLTDANELRSKSITSSLALGISLSIASLTFLPVSVFLTAITTCTPCIASTRAVSVPIPLDAPETKRMQALGYENNTISTIYSNQHDTKYLQQNKQYCGAYKIMDGENGKQKENLFTDMDISYIDYVLKRN